MKNRIISALLSVVIFSSFPFLTSCGKSSSSEESPKAVLSSEEASSSEAVSTEAEFTESSENNSSTSTGNSWADAYYDYLMKFEKDLSSDDYDSIDSRNFAYIYVNDDDIPELVIQGQDEATGNIILTFNNGELDELQTSRLYFNYIEHQNLLCNSDGNMGAYYDSIYSIVDGKWENIAHGEYYVEDNSAQWDDDDLIYEWNGKKMSESEYSTAFRKVYNSSTAKDFEAFFTYSDIKEYLLDEIIGKEHNYLENNSGIHRYEVFVGDVSWDEAMESCREKGGYLLRINNYDEKYFIEQMLKDNNQEKLVIWLGACLNPSDNHYHWTDGEKYAMGQLENNNYYSYYWLTGEPSYTGYDAQGNLVDEHCLCMFQVDGFWEWNDVPSDISPYYPGRIAYICEYEDSTSTGSIEN